MVDKGAFCQEGAVRHWVGVKHTQSPKHWFVELVMAIRVLVWPQGPSERSQGAWPCLLSPNLPPEVCLSLGMSGDRISTGELSMYVFYRAP